MKNIGGRRGANPTDLSRDPVTLTVYWIEYQISSWVIIGWARPPSYKILGGGGGGAPLTDAGFLM